MISSFSTLYAGHILEGEGIGFDGIPHDDRWYSNERLIEVFEIAKHTAILMDDLGYGISKRKVTISTAGVIPGIEKLCETTDASLAVSLHAPNDELRNELVPINKKYPIADLLEVCSRYARNLGEKRTVTIEYTLINGVNDKREHAQQLSRLLEGFPCKINLIPFNPFPGTTYKRPGMKAVREFKDRFYIRTAKKQLRNSSRKSRLQRASDYHPIVANSIKQFIAVQ